MRDRLLLLAPIEPRTTGNGLAMRTAAFATAAQRRFDVAVVVVPVVGAPPGRAGRAEVPVATVAPRPARELVGELSALLASPRWRALLAEVEPMPALARAGSPGLAAAVVAAAGVADGTPVHVMRSYLGPLGLAVADRLAAPWVSLDLDDDDEAALRPVDAVGAAAFGRLVGAVTARCSAVSAASPAEATAIAARHGSACEVVANTVPVPPAAWVRVERQAAAGRTGRAAAVLFVGNLTYRPNLEAAGLLVDEVLPALRARRSGPVEVALVGPYDPGGPVAALGRHDGVTVTGFVEELSGWYAEAALVVAPVRSGAGTRTKLLEAFAHGVPVVTTPVGAAGLAVADGVHVRLGTTAGELAEAAAGLLADPGEAQRQAAAALELVRSSYGPAVAVEQVGRLFEMAARAGRRPV